MSFNDPRIDIPEFGLNLDAYLRTYAANYERSAASGYEFAADEISPAEVNLAALFLQHGVEGWEQQHPIGPYWPDFYFTAVGLVVEVDGRAWHQNPERERKRDETLVKFGAEEVLHIRAIEVFTDGLACVDRVKARVAALTEPTKEAA